MLKNIFFFASLAVGLSAASTNVGVRRGQIKNLVTFGDSYSDVGTPADGGLAWPSYAAQDGGFNLYPFAKSGATCSNNITSRPFPSLYESQLPAYLAERANGTLELNEDETAYTLWIGTNDVGTNGLLTGHGAPGVSVVDTTACAVSWVQTMYNAGARNFLFQNMIPLELTVLYSVDTYYNHYWTLERNSTAWNIAMAEVTKAGNAISYLMLQQLATTLPGAHIGYFNSSALFLDMYHNPSQYLNGTAPLNVTGAVKSCVYAEYESTANTGVCTIANGTARDSFLWYDELHPSEQADRIVGREVAAVLKGTSQNYTTWFS